jgi:hypothetical protein
MRHAHFVSAVALVAVTVLCGGPLAGMEASQR